jgi:hypothetical protein
MTNQGRRVFTPVLKPFLGCAVFKRSFAGNRERFSLHVYAEEEIETIRNADLVVVEAARVLASSRVIGSCKQYDSALR